MAHPDLYELITKLIPFAQQMLDKYGQFYPYAGSMNHDGKVTMIGSNLVEKKSSAQDIVDHLTEILKNSAKNGEIRASVLFTSIKVDPPGESERTSAVCMQLEHENGEHVEAVMPYCKTPDGEYEYSTIFKIECEPEIFGSSKSD